MIGKGLLGVSQASHTSPAYGAKTPISYAEGDRIAAETLGPLAVTGLEA